MPPLLPRTPTELLDQVRREVERNTLRTRNGLKLLARVDQPGVGESPKDVVWERDRVQLWRYHSDRRTHPIPLLIIFSLISRSYIVDLQPDNSFVQRLLNAGFDVYLLDWGVPDERDAHNTLDDYADGYLPAGVRQVLEDSGADRLDLFGYCFGGVLSLMSLAANPQLPVNTLTTMATPVDFTATGLFSELLRDGRLEVDHVLDADGNVPPNVIRQAFRTLKPTADVGQFVTLLDQMWSDDYVRAYQAMTRWTGDHIPFPGAAARDTVRRLIRDNALLRDRLRVNGRPATLRHITCPLLNILATRDDVVPEAAAAPVAGLVGSSDVHEVRLDAGHIGLAVGRSAARLTVPAVIQFLHDHENGSHS